MDYKFQATVVDSIHKLAESKCQSILIAGIHGSGKTYLAQVYRRLCNISDFILVQPSVDNIREVINQYAGINVPAVICMENLDLGSQAAIGAILKFLEEPNSNIKLIITCISLYHLPETIISRCATLFLPNPTIDDLIQYAKTKDASKYELLTKSILNSIILSFSDIDSIFALNAAQLQYIDATITNHKGYIKKTINSTLWDFTHYADNTEIPIDIIKLRIRYILHCNTDLQIRKICLECLDELDRNRIASHVVLYKFLIAFTNYIPA